MSNPLEKAHQTRNLPTTTLPAREVLHTAEAALRPLLQGIQTQEQLDTQRERIYDPPSLNPKGRPRTQRLTGPTEGRARGGGAGSSNGQRNRCGLCHQTGHNRTTCPTVRKE
ncbi:hypothetical protein CPB84DRAFT_1692184 [Gymnopilus junonius]|uniref:Uncharacterized protein n=1 Tax=Gymnopilus junonius TaxID=109634 RepID=A0A9P5N929_GYMJU|nr:hypothetical protein CPB84DRAFT_1692184 [Gymnopilus junonius]